MCRSVARVRSRTFRLVFGGGISRRQAYASLQPADGFASFGGVWKRAGVLAFRFRPIEGAHALTNPHADVNADAHDRVGEREGEATSESACCTMALWRARFGTRRPTSLMCTVLCGVSCDAGRA